MNFPKPQETILRETKRIAVGVALLLAVMLGVYALLGRLSLAVALSGAMGAAYAVFNFFLLGMTVQKVSELREENEELAKAQMKNSYHTRMILMILLVVIAFAVPFLDALACMIPMLFPRVTILVLQLTGKISVK